MEEIRKAVCEAVEALVDAAALTEKQIMILGCSTSEVAGSKIGKGSVYEIGETIIRAALSVLSPRGIYLAVGCCEHLNRAVCMPREAAEKYGFEIVSVLPAIHAGGSAATAAYKYMDNPCMVEFARCHAGMDIGDTFIGMHLRHVAVPVRLPIHEIGCAHVTYAKTRPKYIGGCRAIYEV
ncbi:MAG: TIGR01440 family protein [Clostridia bacterium]|nr:TIGR01440 family protein [Clostridia bacterium]